MGGGHWSRPRRKWIQIVVQKEKFKYKQLFNFYVATLRDVFHYLVQRFDLGHMTTHYLSDDHDHIFMNLDQTLFSINLFYPHILYMKHGHSCKMRFHLHEI